MNRKRLRAEFVGALGAANAKLIAAIAPFSRQAAVTLASPRFQSLIEAYADAQLGAADAARAVADAGDAFGATQSAEAAQALADAGQGLADAALAYKAALVAISLAGEEIKSAAIRGELH
jgi:hypothetical protein